MIIIACLILYLIFHLMLQKILKPVQSIAQEAKSQNTEIERINNLNQKLSLEKNALIANNSRLSEAISSMSSGLIGVDKNSRIILFNHSAGMLTGLNETEVLGKELKEIIKVSDKNGEISQLIYCPTEYFSENPVIYSEKNLILTTLKNNKKATVELTTTKVKGNSLFNFNCIINLHDVTQAKELEDMKFDFVSMAAHELRTPLTSIKGYLSVYMQENRDKLSPDQKMLLDNINGSSERLTSLVENLLNVSRIERGGLTINMQQLDWLDLVKNIVNDHQSKAAEKQISLQLIPPPYSIPQIRADKLRIGEVLSNLLTNAIKYTEPNGQIRVWVELNSKEIITHVSDNGHGIPEEMQPYLFNKFFRANNKLEYGTKGNGLGLYITKSMVELHHGKIWVKSEVGKGSTFSFSLPL